MIHRFQPHFHSGGYAATNQFVVFIDKIIGDAGAQTNNKIIPAGIKMYRGRRQSQPVRSDGFRLTDRRGESKLRYMTKPVKFCMPCQQFFHGWIMIDHRGKDRFAGIKIINQ